jgi:hypothetical protein
MTTRRRFRCYRGVGAGHADYPGSLTGLALRRGAPAAVARTSFALPYGYDALEPHIDGSLAPTDRTTPYVKGAAELALVEARRAGICRPGRAEQQLAPTERPQTTGCLEQHGAGGERAGARGEPRPHRATATDASAQFQAAAGKRGSVGRRLPPRFRAVYVSAK